MPIRNKLTGMNKCILCMIARLFHALRGIRGSGGGPWCLGWNTHDYHEDRRQDPYVMIKLLKERDPSSSGRFINIGITDVGKYHGDVCAGISFGYRACQIAFARLYPGEIPPQWRPSS